MRSLDVLTQTFAVLLATTLVETSRIGGFLSRALLFVLAPVAAAFTHALLSPKRESRCRPRRRDRLRPARPRGCADPARPRRRARLVRGVADDRAALHGRPVRAPTACRACSARIRRSPSASAAAGARTSGADRRRRPPVTGRRATERRWPRKREKGHTLVCPLPEANSAASYSPRGSRPKYHWRRRA